MTLLTVNLINVSEDIRVVCMEKVNEELVEDIEESQVEEISIEDTQE